MSNRKVPELTKLTLHFFLIYTLATGCNATQEKPSGAETKIELITNQHLISDALKPGYVYTAIAINNDELNTFALYLPKAYSTTMTWPVVFFFDSGGNGSLPVAKYKSIADSLGYILVGSNRSKNGQDVNESLANWNMLKQTSMKNFSIDKRRLILAGFSGGARVSCSIASTEPTLAGVIGNSAGAQRLDKIFNANTFFIGIAGKGDMNRAEMRNIEQQLATSALQHYYLEFDGIHAWCPLQTMHKALMLATLNFYQTNTRSFNPELIEIFTTSQKKEIETLKDAGKWVEAYDELIVLHKSTKGLLTSPVESPDSLKNNPKYIEQRNELLQINTLEIKIQQELYKLIVENPDSINWKTKIQKIRKESLLKGDNGSMHQRLLGYASLVCYSLSNRNLSAKNYLAAQTTIACYEIADPKNAEVYFLKAILAGAKTDKQRTIDNLNKSLQLGLNDKTRLLKQTEFIFLAEDKEFLEITNKTQF